MKSRLLSTLIAAFIGFNAHAQCFYVPSTSSTIDSLSYSYTGGSFQSYGCAPIDPTFWLSGSGISVTISFVNPQNYPTFRVWGMNDDDVASVTVNGSPFALTASSAAYDAKVVCGISPGPNGVAFLAGNLVGANTNVQGNYSYQNVQLYATNVTTITVTGMAGAGWGFAGVSIHCPGPVGINELNTNSKQATVYPNPFTSSATIKFNTAATNAELTIYNRYGQQVKTIATVSANQVTINREHLESGLYFFRLMQNNIAIEAGKLVITD